MNAVAREKLHQLKDCYRLVLEIEEGSWPLVQGSGAAFQDEMWEEQSNPSDTGA